MAMIKNVGSANIDEEARKDAEAKKAQLGLQLSQVGTNASNLQGNYKEMYDKLYNRTATHNAQNLATNQRQASQQAAIAGYNPQMAAALTDKLMANAYNANSQQNANLNDQELNLKNQQKQTEEQQWLNLIAEAEKANPELASMLRIQMYSGKPLNDYSNYINESGGFKLSASNQMIADANALAVAVKDGTFDYSSPDASQKIYEALNSANGDQIKGVFLSKPPIENLGKNGKAGDMFLNKDGDPVMIVSIGEETTDHGFMSPEREYKVYTLRNLQTGQSERRDVRIRTNYR